MSDQPTAQPNSTSNENSKEPVVHTKVENLSTASNSTTPDSSETITPVDETKDLGQNQSPKKSGLVAKKLDLSDEKMKDSKQMNKSQLKSVLIISLVAIAAGVGTGFGGHKLQARSGESDKSSPVVEQQVAGDVINNGDVFGIKDDQTFSGIAEGYLEKGGLDGEGSHKLLREGGISQTVYLTSSITDLDKLVDMQVKVWGETFKGQKAGWLMDVGRIQVIEMDAESPEIE